jgi:putative addiction module CopG family antidote
MARPVLERIGSRATVGGLEVIGVRRFDSNYLVWKVFRMAERFGSASEVVRAGLRLLEDEERRREVELERLRRSIKDGRRSRPPKPAEEVFERLEARYRKIPPEP